MSQKNETSIDLTDLPFVRREVSGHPRVFFNSNHPYKKIKEELNKLTEKERSTVDLLQIFRVWGVRKNSKIAQVIRLNHDYYIPIFSSLAPKIYHPKKNHWIIFALLAGIVSISKLEPIKLTDEIFDLVNNGLRDKRKSIRRQAMSVIYAGMYPTFGVESSIKPVFRRKIPKENIAITLNFLIDELRKDEKRSGYQSSLAVKLQLGLLEAGAPITSQIPYSDDVVTKDFERWFDLEKRTKNKK